MNTNPKTLWRYRRWLTPVLVALMVAACVPVDSDGDGGLGSAAQAIAVVEGTVIGVEDGVVLVGTPVMVADLERPGLADWTGKLGRQLESNSGDQTLGLRFSQGEFPEASRHAFFVGALVINDQWDEDFSVLYAHDLATDMPAGPWIGFRSGTGRETVDVLECLVTSFNTSGDRRGLEALIEASIESNTLEDSDEGTLRRCALEMVGETGWDRQSD